MTRAFSIRLSDDLLARAKQRAHDTGTSFTAFVAGAIEARLEAPPLTQIPMKPLPPTSDVSRGAEIGVFEGVRFKAVPQHPLDKPPATECAHPFRDNQNRCRVCGHVR